MTNPYRAMCAELLAWAEHTSSHYYKQPDVLTRARALLAQPEPGVPTDDELQPVAVSERLPGPKDCKSGECWGWEPAAESWNRTHYAVCNHFTHWLPANALPVPDTNV